MLIKQLYKTYMGCSGREGVKWARDLVSVRKVGRCGLHEGGPCCYQAMSKLIIVKSVVGIISCLCVLCNYTKYKIYNVQ